jgi:hypothetical protein
MTDKKISNGITTTDFKDDGENLIVTQQQDITDIVEANKADYNATDSKASWGDTLNNRVARIPLSVFTDLEKQGITRGFTVIDMKRFKDWLNNPDNRVFRTRAGRI